MGDPICGYGPWHFITTLFQSKMPANPFHNLRGHLKNRCHYSRLCASSGTSQLEVRVELLPACRALHEHPADVVRKSQLLAAFRALHFSIVTHGFMVSRGGVSLIVY